MKEFNGMVIVDNLEVRNEPLIADENIIGALNKDDTFKIDIKEGGFYLIHYDGVFAYVLVEGTKLV